MERSSIRDATDELFTQVMALNAISVFACLRAALPIMEAAGGDAIISTTSLAARNGCGGRSVLHAAAKGFVSSFTRGLRGGAVQHPGERGGLARDQQANKNRTTPPHQIEASLRMTPVRRQGTVEECVGADLYLASGALSSFVMGQVVELWVAYPLTLIHAARRRRC